MQFRQNKYTLNEFKKQTAVFERKYLMDNNNVAENKLVDSRFNILSYEQFLIDNKEKKFNKICMTEVVNADMMIATFGEERYNNTSAEILALGNLAYKQMGIDNIVHVYIHTYKTFMAVANDDISDDDFYNLMKANHEQYELIRAQQTGLSGVSRFAVAFGDDLINRVLSAYYLNKENQNNFLVASNERDLLLERQEKNVEILEILTYAIENDRVVPFYQGIYNNEKKEIKKYEALMRVYDKDNNLCMPGMFLEASKELKMYLTLSKIIIDKALKDFEGKQSELSLNISLLDIKSDEFRAWMLERLKQHPTPNKVIVEFVETENYNKNNLLFDFLKEVRDVGCRIAVDDFGVGYATYTSIISLKPAIIKIDGDIIKTLETNNDSVIILDSIKYMSELIGSETIAEFVENEEIQKISLKHGVNYSQGYYFAKPEPLENLNII